MSPVRHVVSRVVKAAFPAPLMTSLRLARRASLTAFAAVDIAVVLGLAKVDDGRAACAGNPYQNLDNIHARTPKAALIELASPVRFGHLRPVCVHARHEGSGLYTWAFIYFAVIDRLPDALSRRHFSAESSMLRFLRI